MTVFVVRGDVVRRYPTAHYFLQKATARRDDTIRPVAGQVDPRQLRGALDRDTLFVGFEKTPPEVIGDRADGGDPGWLLAIEEQPAAPRFGLDDPPEARPTTGRPRRLERDQLGQRRRPERRRSPALTHAPVDVDVAGTRTPIEDTTWGQQRRAHGARLLAAPFRMLHPGRPARLAMPTHPAIEPGRPHLAARARVRDSPRGVRHARPRAASGAAAAAPGGPLLDGEHPGRAAGAHLPGRDSRRRAPTGADGAEQKLGHAFWRALLARRPGAAVTAAHDAAFAWLAGQAGPWRAAWIARAMRPLNTEPAPARPVAGRPPLRPPPQFPNLAEPSHAGAPTYARLLPDRFALVAWDDTRRSSARGGASDDRRRPPARARAASRPATTSTAARCSTPRD